MTTPTTTTPPATTTAPAPTTPAPAATPAGPAATRAPARSPLDLDLVATTFARHGVASVAAELDVLAHRARALRIDAPSVAVMVDPTAPEVVRARAFSHVVRLLARVVPATTADSFVAVA